MMGCKTEKLVSAVLIHNFLQISQGEQGVFLRSFYLNKPIDYFLFSHQKKGGEKIALIQGKLLGGTNLNFLISAEEEMPELPS